MSGTDSVTIKAPLDAHVHLRQGNLMKLVAPHVRQGGVRTAFVMPNLIPPLTTPSQTVDYVHQLSQVAPDLEVLPSMYLSSTLTPELIKEAKEKGIVGIKSYPRGVTTNSEGGVGMEGYSVYDEVFAEMERQDIVLNLHGEVPSDVDGDGTCVLNAEERFIPHLYEIHRKFPKLRIVLEHCTTAAAVEAVKSLPSNVVATITPHHLHLTIDSACSTSLGFCKPLAKFPSDRKALREIISSGNPKFFLGSDSAPHPSNSKLPALQVMQIRSEENGETKEEVVLPSPCAAGIYTSSNLIPLTAEIFERSGIPLERLEGFVSDFGRSFYRVPAKEGEEVTIKRIGGGGKEVEKVWGYEKDGKEGGREYVIPFLAGEKIGWEIAQ
ncbi:dihydroorotase [Sporobolomyces salmoneus]|uniref:dihydroorotase n=1 Tax=Sporobolomyces salmoneus TaxID=183962 RepID=UPI00317FE2B1